MDLIEWRKDTENEPQNDIRSQTIELLSIRNSKSTAFVVDNGLVVTGRAKIRGLLTFRTRIAE